MFKINLHAHTLHSDGSATIEKMAETCKELEFTACVITDHVYSDDGRPSITYSQYLNEILPEAIEAQEKVGIPLIVGIEAGIGRLEECLIFGTDAIKTLFKIRQNIIDSGVQGNLSIDDVEFVRNEHDCAVILCHPQLPIWGDRPSERDGSKPVEAVKNWITEGGVKVIDGYEGVNSGQPMFGKFRDVPKEFDGLVSFCNSDAHNYDSLEMCYNETDTPIYSEDDLIRYIRGRGFWGHHVVPWRYT